MQKEYQNTELKKRPLALGLTLTGALLRLLPHLPNFAPVGGLSLFAGARLRSWQAYGVPLVIMAASDPILGLILGYPAYTLVTPFVYCSFLIYVWIGSHLRRTEKLWRIAGATILGSLQFFLISNFGVWASGISVYPLTLSGLMACYIGAIPFFGRTVASDLLYGGVLFGLHAWLARVAFSQERVMDEVVVPTE